MQIHGTVVNVETDVQITKNGGGTYPGTRFSYRDSEGKLSEKAFHNNTFKFNKELKNQLAALVPGQSFVAEAIKENDFWNWKTITAGTGTVQTAGANTDTTSARATPSPRSTYETPEERAKKQVYIVRQSSITSAIAFLHKGDAVPTVDNVIDVAKQFEAYVFGTEFDNGTLMTMKDDSHEVY